MHSKLDEFLCDEALVEERRLEQLAKPNKVNIGNECPVCDQAISKQHSRVHVIWHFMEELRGIVQSFNNPTVRFGMRYESSSFTTATAMIDKEETNAVVYCRNSFLFNIQKIIYCTQIFTEILFNRK